jgi:transposase
MISAISPKGALRFMVVEGGVGVPQLVEFLRRMLINGKRPIFLILDGHPVHRSKAVKEFVRSSEGTLRVFYLPPYSPELNPDELVWNDVKNNGVGRKMICSPVDLKKGVIPHLRGLQKNPEKVQSFFQAPSTRYAA